MAREKIEDRINALLEKVRPYIQMHGGDVQLLRIEDNTAVMKVHGACVNCSLASVTYNKTIGPLVIKEIEEIEKVEFE
jgi:Fe-S cluster biogenesis protein NfuA